jgi:hypothetical protein
MKYIMMITVVGFFCIACNQAQNTTTTPVSTINTTSIANQLFQKFNAHDWVGMANLYTDTAYFKDPSLGIAIVKQTRQQTIEKYTALQKDVNDIKDSVVAIYPSTSKNITVEFISKGTMPNGSKFELPICTILTINERGLIEKDFTYYDNAGNK